MRGMIRSLGVVGLALLSVVGLAVAWTAATVVQLTATALIMGGTDHPLSAPATTPATSSRTWTTPSRCSSTRRRARPRAPARTRSTGWARPTKSTRSSIPREFFPVFGSQTFDSSVAAGRANLNGCVRGTECALQRPSPPPEDPPGSARRGGRLRGLRLLAERRRRLAGEAGLDREPADPRTPTCRSSCWPTRCVPTAASCREGPRV